MSKNLLKRLGWKINHASDMTLIVADGQEAAVLGEITEVTVTLGNAKVPINLTITESHSFNVILGNDFLEKIKAEISLVKLRMKFTWHGITYYIPLDINRGIRPEESGPESVQASSDNSSAYHKVYTI